MNAEKKVFSRLFTEEKTELATQKIELGSVKELKMSISDIKGLIQSAERVGNKLGSDLGSAEKTKRNLNDVDRDLRSAVNLAKNELSSFENKAKELGLSASNVSEVKELEKLMQDVKEYTKFINGIPKIPQI